MLKNKTTTPQKIKRSSDLRNVIHHGCCGTERQDVSGTDTALHAVHEWCGLRVLA